MQEFTWAQISITQDFTCFVPELYYQNGPRKGQVICATKNSVINNLSSKDPKGCGVRQILVNSDPINTQHSPNPRTILSMWEGRHWITQERGSCNLPIKRWPSRSSARITRSSLPTDLQPPTRRLQPKLPRRAPGGAAGSTPQDGKAPQVPRQLVKRTSRRPDLARQPPPGLGAPWGRGRLRLRAHFAPGTQEPAISTSQPNRPTNYESPSAPRHEDTHRARRLLLAAGRHAGRLGGGPRPVVQAGEGVPSGHGRAAAASARCRERAEGQPGRQGGAAGRRLGPLLGRRGGPKAPAPFPSEPQCLWRPFETGRVAGHRQCHHAPRRPRTRPAATPGASRAPRPRPDVAPPSRRLSARVPYGAREAPPPAVFLWGRGHERALGLAGRRVGGLVGSSAVVGSPGARWLGSTRSCAPE